MFVFVWCSTKKDWGLGDERELWKDRWVERVPPTFKKRPLQTRVHCIYIYVMHIMVSCYVCIMYVWKEYIYIFTLFSYVLGTYNYYTYVSLDLRFFTRMRADTFAAPAPLTMDIDKRYRLERFSTVCKFRGFR